MRAVGDAIDRTATPSSTWEFTKAAARSGLAAPWAMTPLISLMIACRLKPRTILALSVHSGGVASTPMSAPVVVMAMLLRNFVHKGAYYPRGGGQTLSAGFAEVIRGRRPKIHIPSCSVFFTIIPSAR
jgi:all-trans-retinol 13,14-reductase